MGDRSNCNATQCASAVFGTTSGRSMAAVKCGRGACPPRTPWPALRRAAPRAPAPSPGTPRTSRAAARGLGSQSHGRTTTCNTRTRTLGNPQSANPQIRNPQIRKSAIRNPANPQSRK
eukprot:14530354-Alexandrium_andersonii.AAC.1